MGVDHEEYSRHCICYSRTSNEAPPQPSRNPWYRLHEAAVAPHSEFWSGRCCALNMPPLSTLCVGLITKTYSTRRISHLGTPNEEPLQPLCNPPYQLHYRWGGTSFSVLEWEMWCLEYAYMINPTHRGAYRSASLPNPTHFFKSLGYVFRPIGLSCVEFLSQFNQWGWAWEYLLRSSPAWPGLIEMMYVYICTINKY